MVYHVNKNTTPEELKKIFDILRTEQKGMTVGKPINARKYMGKVAAKGNPVTLQRLLRNEWL